MPRDRWSLIVGSLGLGLVLAGLMVFVAQAVEAIDTGRWPPSTLGTLMRDPMGQRLVPFSFRAWLERPGSWHALHGAVRWFVDVVPLALLLGGAGLYMTWKAARLDRARVGE